MKKLFLVLAAAFAMVACQTDLNEVNVESGLVDVTFEVGAPAARAYSDGTTATVLQYAVYEGADENATLLSSLTGTKEIHGSTTVPFKLVTGNTYTVLFWAAAEGAPYEVTFANKLKDAKMEVSYTGAVSNAENRDAFYKRHIIVVKGAQTENIELRRPFAQLNIGANDFEAAEKAGYTPDLSYVKVTSLGSILNLWNDEVEGEPAVITFGDAAIPANETFPVAGNKYLAMNYLLVDSQKEVVDIEFGYTDTDENIAKVRTVGSVPVQRNYRTNIYGQLLTSDVDIVVEIKPEYDGEHNGGAASGNITYVETLAQLQAALDQEPVAGIDHYIYLAADITGDVYVTRTENGGNIVIDGQEHKYDGQIRIKGMSENGKETTVIRNINFETATKAMDFIWSNDTANGSYWRYANNVTVENCDFKATGEALHTAVAVKFQQAYNIAIKGCTADGLHSLCQFQSYDNALLIEGVTITNGKNGISLGNSAKVTIKNAEVHAAEYGIRADGNASRGDLVIEESTIEAKQPIVVRKVTTSGYSVKVDDATVLTTTEPYHIVFTKGSDDVAYVAPTVEFACDAPARYVVFPDFSSATVVASVAELNAALADTSVDAIVLTAGVNYGTIVMKSNKTIFGVEGAVVECVNLYGAKNVTIKNIVFDAATAVMNYDGKNVGRQMANIVTGSQEMNPKLGAHNVTIDGCTFTGTFANGGAAISFADRNRISGQSKNITIKNCTFNTVNGYYDIYGYYFGGEEMHIENNVFLSTRSQGKNIYIGQYQSNVPVVVKGNSFTVSTIEEALGYTAHSGYTVTISASDNTFGIQ